MVSVLIGGMLLMIGFGAFIDAVGWKSDYFGLFYGLPVIERVTPDQMVKISVLLMIISLTISISGLILWRKASRA
jgi:hypothetical protein